MLLWYFLKNSIIAQIAKLAWYLQWMKQQNSKIAKDIKQHAIFMLLCYQIRKKYSIYRNSTALIIAKIALNNSMFYSQFCTLMAFLRRKSWHTDKQGPCKQLVLSFIEPRTPIYFQIRLVASQHLPGHYKRLGVN